MLASIALPCRRLDFYVRNAVAVALSSTRDAEIVVSLNDGGVSRSEVDDWLETLSQPSERLRVVRPNRLLSMTENFRFAFNQLSGDWQTVIGSDDGVLPTLEPLLSFADAHPDSPTVALFPRASYFWPGVDETYGAAHVDLSSKPTYRMRSAPTKGLPEVMLGLSNYLILPQVYTGGAIHRDAVARIGIDRLFSSLSPDVSASVALAVSNERIIEFGVPAFWVGTSINSNGLAVNRTSASHADVETAANPSEDHFKARSEEFFELSEADGHGIDEVFSDLPNAKFVVAASAHTSALQTRLVSQRTLDRFAAYARYAVVNSAPGTSGRLARLRLSVAAADGSTRASVSPSPALVWVHLILRLMVHRAFNTNSVARIAVLLCKIRALSMNQRLQIRIRRRQDAPITMQQATDEAVSAGLLDQVAVLSEAR